MCQRGVSVHIVPCLDSAEPSKTARLGGTPGPALAISGQGSCFLYWDRSTTGGGPGSEEGKRHENNPYNLWMFEPYGGWTALFYQSPCEKCLQVYTAYSQQWVSEITEQLRGNNALLNPLVESAGYLEKRASFLTHKQATKTHTYQTFYLENMNTKESNDLKTALSEVLLWVIWVLECRKNKKERAKEKGDKGKEREMKRKRKMGALIKQTPLILAVPEEASRHN